MCAHIPVDAHIAVWEYGSPQHDIEGTTTMTTNEMLALLNTHRASQGLSPLKAWKASREKLRAALDVFATSDAHKRASEQDAANAHEERENAKAWNNEVRKLKPNKMKDVGTPPIVPRKNARKVDVVQPANAKGDFTSFLKQRNLNPKVARAKLRRAGLKGPYVLNPEIKKILVG
jgi:hypothetical protein